MAVDMNFANDQRALEPWIRQGNWDVGGDSPIPLNDSYGLKIQGNEMTTKRAPSTTIPDDFYLDETTLNWLARRYPQVDAEIACERFVAWASEYCYANWQRTFQNYVIRMDDESKLRSMLKKSTPSTQVNEWPVIEAEALRVGFRKRIGQETIEQFKAALEAHGKRNANRVLQLLPAAFKRA